MELINSIDEVEKVGDRKHGSKTERQKSSDKKLYWSGWDWVMCKLGYVWWDEKLYKTPLQVLSNPQTTIFGIISSQLMHKEIALCAYFSKYNFYMKNNFHNKSIKQLLHNFAAQFFLLKHL